MGRASLAAFLLFTLAGFPAQPIVSETVLAVATHGALLPIARLTADGWVDSWPGSEEDEVPVPALNDIPIAWLGRRVPVEWNVWFTAGGTARVRVNGTQRYGGCVSPPALTMATVESAPRGAFDDVHLGIATDTAQVIHPLRAVPRASRSATVRAAIGTASRRLIGRDDGIASLFESGERQSAVYYFETREARLHGRQWPSLVRGWLRRDPKGSLQAVGTEIHACGYDGPGTRPHSCLIPLGVLRQSDHELWIMEHPEGETDAFELWKIASTGAERILVSDAGGC